MRSGPIIRMSRGSRSQSSRRGSGSSTFSRGSSGNLVVVRLRYPWQPAVQLARGCRTGRAHEAHEISPFGEL